MNNLGFLNIYGHYDGPLYIIAAKTFYNPELINSPSSGYLIISLPLSASYFAAHLPLYPILIKLFSFVFGYLKSLLFVNLLFTIFLAGLFYFLVKSFRLTKKPLLLTVILLFLPRFLVLRSIGAPESMFLFFILLSLYFFEKENYFLAGLCGALSVVTKIPGILLFPAYVLVFLENYIKNKKIELKWIYILFIPLGLLAVFMLYAKQYGDFFAYFHTNTVVPMPFPFSAFNSHAKWVGTAWLEDVLFYFFLYLSVVFSFFTSKFRSFFYFSLVFFIALTFVEHRDIARYSLPLWPLACMAFEKTLTSRKFILIFIVLMPAIYLYAWNFLLQNVMPIGNWKPFL